MMCLINYLSACRRLKECDKFIQLHGKKNIPDQILAQRDMIWMEKDFYREEFGGFLIRVWIIFMILIFIFTTWKVFYNV